MISVIKWILFAVFIFGTFASDETHEYFGVFPSTETNQTYKWKARIFINGVVYESSHISKIEAARASDVFLIKHGKDFDRCKLNFSNNKTTPNEDKYTDLHLSLQKGGEEIIHFLLNEVGKEKTEKWIQYFIKEVPEYDDAVLNQASKKAHKEVVKSLLNTYAFNEEQGANLINFLIKKNNKFSYLDVLEDIMKKKESFERKNF